MKRYHLMETTSTTYNDSYG